MNARKSLMVLSLTALFATSFVGAAETVVEKKVDKAQAQTRSLRKMLKDFERCAVRGNCSSEKVQKLRKAIIAVGATSAAALTAYYVNKRGVRGYGQGFANPGIKAVRNFPGQMKSKWKNWGKVNSAEQ